VELPDAVELVTFRRLTLRLLLRCPAPPADRADVQRSELVERERAVRVMLQRELDPIQLRVAVGVVGLLPRLRPLERHLVRRQDLAEPFTADRHHPRVTDADEPGEAVETAEVRSESL